MEKKIILLLILVLIAVGVTGCVSPTGNTPGVMDETRATPREKPIATEEDAPVPTVSNMTGIAHALGCMFAPDTCQTKKDLGGTEENKQ